MKLTFFDASVMDTRMLEKIFDQKFKTHMHTIPTIKVNRRGTGRRLDLFGKV